MQRDKDLPLFTWQPPVCSVIPFPVQRRIGEIRKAAQSIAGAKSDRDGDFKWNRALGAFHQRMKKAGLPADVIEREINGFHILVYTECLRIGSRLAPALPGQQEQPGGAA
ncbi:hypothetical protein SAMN05428967_2222 [Phyllobacterium sp. YR620]|uniref:DUF6074 family protein n=1 Tax=Phyllobacterium sp. YR620 TaxID=1881066 RepID=UPI00088B9653|nr:DUF6074 family protein [Phyllobacterium sp. YR620]SDP46084.1 hypothetical protein SAMN05428967_2222 [Phyllobacterium sp. YR620]